MADIDLIPTDYRDRTRKKSMIVKYCIAIVALNSMLLLISMTLSHQVGIEQNYASELKSRSLTTQQQQTQLQQLQEEWAAYAGQWSLLRSLRAGAAIDDVFSMVDQAVGDGDLWFDEWSFRRAGVNINGQQSNIDTGYFVIVDGSSERRESSINGDLSVETHMTISGHALDHQALSKFVRALFEQADVQDVRVQKTAKATYANGVAVNFDLTVTLNSTLSES